MTTPRGKRPTPARPEKDWHPYRRDPTAAPVEHGGRTPPDILAALGAGGILPVFWRRVGGQRWHRGFRQGGLMVRSQCDRIAAADGGRLAFAPIEGPWPEPHCRACETATPGGDAVRKAASLTDPDPPDEYDEEPDAADAGGLGSLEPPPLPSSSDNDKETPS